MGSEELETHVDWAGMKCIQSPNRGWRPKLKEASAQTAPLLTNNSSRKYTKFIKKIH
jgi:hypothetical protein